VHLRSEVHTAYINPDDGYSMHLSNEDRNNRKIREEIAVSTPVETAQRGFGEFASKSATNGGEWKPS